MERFEGTEMSHYMNFLERSWWVLLVRGIAAIIFGISAFAWPGLTVAVLMLIFGVYVLVDGTSGIVDSIRYRDRISNWWLWLLEGVLGVIVGLLALFMPGEAALLLLTFIAVWSIVGGALRVLAAIHLRKKVEGEWLLGAGGVVSILFGILLIVMPVAGILSLVWLIGVWALVFGVLFCALAFRLRKAGKERRASEAG